MSVVGGVLSAMRSRLGRRAVNWTPDFMGFGNHLYLWVWATEGQHDPLERRVLLNDRMRPWADQVPEFRRAHLVERGDVRFLDVRDHYWARPLEATGHARGFSVEGRNDFVREWLLPSPLLAGVADSPLGADDVLCVNVRRGDYYSDPGHRQVHGIDLAAYLRLAVAGSVERDGPLRRVHVVSDDLGWCRDQLAWLSDVASEITYADPGDPPAQNFRDICAARRLVVSNSTFSMWAAFVSTALHGDNAAQIWAPAFFMSTYEPGRCFEYDQDWSFVDQLPDGWQPRWVLDGAAQP